MEIDQADKAFMAYFESQSGWKQYREGYEDLRKMIEFAHAARKGERE